MVALEVFQERGTNPELAWGVERNAREERGDGMSLIKRLFGKGGEPKRTRICVECGMPVAEHKEWCSILRGQNEMKLKGMTLSGEQS
jgi:hypothetical protein